MLNVAKCNLGKVNLKSTCPAVFLINMHEGWPQGFVLPCADESAISAICSSFGIIAVFLKCFTNNLLRCMYRSIPNSMDATLFVADTQAASSSQQNSSSSSQQTFPPISSCLQLCPIVAGFPRHHGPGGESCVCIRTNSSCSLQHCGCLAEDNVKCSAAISDSSLVVAAQALGPYTSSLLGIGSSLPSHSSSLAASSQPGRPAFVVPSFVATFAPPIPALVSFGTSASLASALQVVSTNSTSLLLPPILHQAFITGPGISPGSTKLVSEIISGKYVDLSNLLSPDLAYLEPEPQLLFDGCVVLSACPKKTKRCITDIV